MLVRESDRRAERWKGWPDMGADCGFIIFVCLFALQYAFSTTTILKVHLLETNIIFCLFSCLIFSTTILLSSFSIVWWMALKIKVNLNTCYFSRNFHDIHSISESFNSKSSSFPWRTGHVAIYEWIKMQSINFNPAVNRINLYCESSCESF